MVTTGLRRAVGWSGLASIVLLFGSQGFAQAGGTEPAFDAPAADIVAFMESRNPTLFPIGSYVGLLGLVALLCFVASVSVLLRSIEGSSPWRATVALACGIAAVGPIVVGGWDVAYLRVDEGIGPELVRFAYDAGNLGFANAWVLLAGFALATGAVLLTAADQPRWLGWWAVAVGVALVAARAVWTSDVWFFAYAPFWLWVATFSVRTLIRQSSSTRSALT